MDKAWLLTETWRDGSVHIEGIALTNEAASAWVSGYFEFGHARTSIPYPIVTLRVYAAAGTAGP